MKIVNNTDKDLKIYFGAEAGKEPEGVIELKSKHEVKIGGEDDSIFIIADK